MARQSSDLDVFEREFRDSLGDQRTAEIGVLEHLSEAQTLMQVFLEHESVRIESKLGAKDPRSASLKATADFNLAQINALNDEIEIGRIRVPPSPEGDAVVHGRVKGQGGRGIPGLTVCLVDQANDALAGLDPATTDGSGYYSIAVPLGAGRYQRQASRRGIFLAVFTAAGKLLHRGKQPLELAKGARLQVEVTLPGETILETGKADSSKPEEKRRKSPAAGAAPAGKTPSPHAAILEPLSKDRGFAEIGASARKLENRFGALGLESKQAIAGLLERADRDVRDGLKLPNLKSARAFKRILAKVLEKSE